MANPSTYSTLYVFGDSFADAGNVSVATAPFGTRIPVSPPYYQQGYGPGGLLTASVFSNGPVWAQDLSGLLGLGTLAPSLYGGTDFAYGGAETGADTSGTSFLTGVELSAISLPSQLAQFQSSVAAPSAGALYAVAVGTNDLEGIVATPGLSFATMAAQAGAAASSEVAFVSSLADRGAQNLLILDAPDLGGLPVVTQGGSAATDALATRLSALFNLDLNAAVEGLAQARGLTLHILPTASLLDEAVADPAPYGLTNTTTPVWSGNLTSASSGALATTDPAQQNQYLFWDEYHPTAHVHALIAADAQSLVTGTGSALYPVPTVGLLDTATGASSVQFGTVYAGPVPYLQGQFLYPGLDGAVISATQANMYLAGGPGEDALDALSGDNVLDGGGGSNFLVGGPAGSGADTFFLDGRGGQTTWDTLVNFHAGDALTLWGFVPGQSSYSWTDNQGAAGYTGATLNVAFGGAAPATGSVTFAGVALADAQARFGITAGTAGGIPYLAVSAHG